MFLELAFAWAETWVLCYILHDPRFRPGVCS
jgi:hypothetical protein